MGFLVDRARSVDKTNYPDYESHPSGLLTHETTARKAIEQYARKVHGRAPLVGEVYEVQPVAEATQYAITATSFKIEEVTER
jgi:hypothetical protein